MIKKLQHKFYHFLRKSQKFTGTDNVYIAKYGSYLTLGKFIISLISFLLAIAYAKFLPKEVYGEYRYILSLVALITITSLPGMNTAAIQSIARGFENVVRTSFKEKLKWSLLGGLIVLGMAVYSAIQANYSFAIALGIIAFLWPFTESRLIYQAYLNGKKRFDVRIKYEIISHIFLSIAIAATVIISNKLVYLILTYFVIKLISVTFFYKRTLKKYPPNNKIDPQAIKYGKHLSIMAFMSIIAENIDKVILFNLLGPIQLAIYSFATIPIQYLRMPLKITRELAFPKLSVRSKEELKKTLPNKIFKITILFVPILIIAYFFIAPLFYKIFFIEYIESVKYSLVFSLSLIFFPASMLTLAIESKKDKKSLYKINIIHIIVQVTLFFILIPPYGIMGVVIARLMANAVNLFFSYFYFRRL